MAACVNFELVERAAAEFVKAMLPADQARIGSFARVSVDPLEFTSDREELLKILRTELQPEGPTPLWNAVNVGISALLSQEGRRVVLVFTDGADAPMNFRNNNQSLKDVMRRAEEENVMVRYRPRRSDPSRPVAAIAAAQVARVAVGVVGEGVAVSVDVHSSSTAVPMRGSRKLRQRPAADTSS